MLLLTPWSKRGRSSRQDGGRKELDIKRYAKVEKIPGGEISDSRVLKGVMMNKDVTHGKMRRKIVKPRVLLLDCTLECVALFSSKAHSPSDSRCCP